MPHFALRRAMRPTRLFRKKSEHHHHHHHHQHHQQSPQSHPLKPQQNAKRRCSSVVTPQHTVPALEARLYDAVRNFLLLAEFFVCAPHGVHRPQRNAADMADRCCDQLLQWLHIIWCGALYAGLSACVYTEYTQSNIDLPTVQKPLYFCEYLVYLVHICQIIVSIYMGRRKFHSFLRTIVEFDHALLTFDVQPAYQLLAQFVRRHLLLIAGHFICTVIVDYYYSDCIMVKFIRSTCVYIMPNLILELSLVQYYALLYAITERSVRLNAVLRNQLSRKLSAKLLHEQLHQLRLLYSCLQLFTKQVNDAFAQSLVLVYIGSFMNISVNIFLIYKYMDDLDSADFWWIMYSVVWTFMHIGKMFLILYYNHCVQNQKNYTALVLNDLKGQNAEMEETITHFILQLIINTRTNVVCGVARLNMDFITSLLVAISTLFIFLLQYDITFEALTKQHNSGSPNRSA